MRWQKRLIHQRMIIVPISFRDVPTELWPQWADALIPKLELVGRFCPDDEPLLPAVLPGSKHDNPGFV
jgi:hypothetical protein